MARTYPDFIEDAKRFDFYHVGKDRWDYLEQDGYRKLSTVLQKSKDIDWKRLYVYYHDMYILIQYITNYDEKYDGNGDGGFDVETVTEDEFKKIIEENIDNPYINWDGIYGYVEDDKVITCKFRRKVGEDKMILLNRDERTVQEYRKLVKPILDKYKTSLSGAIQILLEPYGILRTRYSYPYREPDSVELEECAMFEEQPK